jgi:tetratricopeptide (TPR) repeat protein
VVLIHSLACAVVASSCYLLLPSRFRQPRSWVGLLLFNFAFIAPVFGALGIILITRISLQRAQRESHRATPVSIEIPQYYVLSSDSFRSGQGAIRSRLNANVPSDIRMQALLTLQAVPGRVANPILENLLGDETDDVRLLAFGMLDSAEKKISVQIQHERILLDTETSPEQRFDCLRHLAELHWEMIYTSLAQGELRRHILSQARNYLEQALAIGIAPSPGLLFLKGRILLAQNEVDPAETAILQALEIGLSRISALPYLAEIAYRRRQFNQVNAFMNQLTHFNIAPRPRAVADLWTGRDKVSLLSDFNHLPHL